jgi:hypothetical protein
VIAFLQPLALLGLLAAAIPTVLHLLARRVPPTVTFPAVRYLEETERRQSRRLKLRHLLLLLLRTALLASVVLAAARPVARMAVGGAHAPTALVLIVDNSLSAGIVVEGRTVADLLAARGREIAARVGQGDRLWLVLADGLPRAVTPAEAIGALENVSASPRRLDLGMVVRTSAGIAGGQMGLAPEIVVLSDLQRSALSGGEPVRVPVLAWTPGVVPENRSLDTAGAEPEVWSPEGQVVASVSGVRRVPAALSLSLGGQDRARAVAYPGDRVILAARGSRPGWLAGRAALDPDELRADDEWFVAARVAAPAPAAVEASAGRYLEQALAVLLEGGRVEKGRTVVIADRPAGARSIVIPPSDPAEVGDLNRALAARGVQWQYGPLVQGEWRLHGEVGPAEGVAVRRRYRLNGSGAILARADDEPWLVRQQDVVLLGSRPDAEWTDLPLTAAFVPFVDLLVNRVAAGEAEALNTHPGDVVQLPPMVDAVLTPTGPVPVVADGRFDAPREPGVYFLRGPGGDTVGALTVNHDPRESNLVEADQRVLRAALGPDAVLLSRSGLDGELFGGAGRADLSGAFLLAALLAAAAELAVASVGARRERGGT